MSTKRSMTLPTDSTERKSFPLLRGCLAYFPAALAGVARISKLGNDKHNPGQPMHHARGKSADHGDCILRHLVDTEDLLAAAERSGSPLTPKGVEDLLTEVSSLAWRALAYSQELHERFGAPMAPGAQQTPTAELKSSYTLSKQPTIIKHGDRVMIRKLSQAEREELKEIVGYGAYMKELEGAYGVVGEENPDFPFYYEVRGYVWPWWALELIK